jgi:hypothetical protein
MTAYSTFMTGVYDWLYLVTGFGAGNIFRQNQQNPDLGPDVSWATYKEISGTMVDYPLEKVTDHDPDVTPGVQLDTLRVFPGTSMVSVNIYAANGADILRNLYASRAERAPRVLLKTAGVVLLSMAGPRDLAELSNTKWKHRFQADFTFNSFTERTELDYVMDIVDLTGKIETDEVEVYVDRNG